MADRDDDLPDLDAPAELPVETTGGLIRPVDPYAGMSMLALSQQQADTLTRRVDPELVEILPTGEPYMQQVNYRRALNEAFGPARWGLKPLGPLTMRENILFREWALYVQGHFISSAVGQQEYFGDNERQTFGDAAESVKSNALMRCCKDLGVASECWDRRWAQQFRKDHCVQVKVKRKRNNQTVLVDQWRRKDQDPLPYEVEGPAAPVETTAREQPKDASQVRPEDGKAPGPVPVKPSVTPEPVPRAALSKVWMPSDVFQAGMSAQWSTKQLNSFIHDKFGKTVSLLEKGDECGRAVAAVAEAAKEPA